MQPYYLTIGEVNDLFSSRKSSPVELVEIFLRRIQSVDSSLHSFLYVAGEQAMAQARQLEKELSAGRRRGPLHGVPYALKDAYATAGIPTTGNSRLLADNIPTEDAHVVRRLTEAGAILLGKLATYELTYGGTEVDTPWPPARNPWDPARDTGGSSSGSGAAVAAGLCTFSLGTDTGGSIRKPAALCGICGFKPTYGRVSRHGVLENSYTLDTCGPMTRSVKDAAIVMDVIGGPDAKDETTLQQPPSHFAANLADKIKGLRIGLLRSFYERDCPASAEIHSGMEAAIDVLKRLGTSITEVEFPALELYAQCKIVIQWPEIYAVYRGRLEERPEMFGSKFRRRISPGAKISAVEYFEAQQTRRRLAASMKAAMADVDVLVTSGFYGPAPFLNETVPDSNFRKLDVCVPFSVARMPSISLCSGFSKEGLPLAIQFAGRPFDDENVLRAAYAYEQATTWHTRHPIP